MRVTIIIPFHSNLNHLAQSLPAARRAAPDAQIIVAADGAVVNCGPLATECRAEVVRIAGPLGPATARNRAASVATGEILVFVDADVVVREDAVRGMHDLLAATPTLAATFGAYDLRPPEPNFMSQFKNLSHAYVHQISHSEASTFWAGLGAVKTEAFRAVGGFDERFQRPSVEDIEFGYRLKAMGYLIRLDLRFRGTHLKRWTWGSAIKTDIQARGLPWTQLIHRTGGMSNDLNTRSELRLSVVASYGVVAGLAAMIVTPWASFASVVSLAALVWLNGDYYRWLALQRGTVFGIKAIAAHLVHHLCNGFSFVAGTLLHFASRFGLHLPGALPPTRWTGTLHTRMDG